MPPKANAKKSAPAAKAAKKDTKKAAPKKASSGKGNGVYVKGLVGMNKAAITEAFTGQFGAVEEVRLRNKKGGKSYALVFFKNPAHAAKAAEFNGRQFKGSKINVELARSDATPDRATFCTAVYVGNLPGGMRRTALSKKRKAKSKHYKKGVSVHAKLAEIFKGCGKTVKARAYQSHGFVFFDSVDAAKQATKKDGLAVAGRKISVKLSVKTPAQLKAKAANAKTLAAAKKNLRVRIIEARRKRMKDVHRKAGQEAAARAAKRKIYRQ